MDLCRQAWEGGLGRRGSEEARGETEKRRHKGRVRKHLFQAAPTEPETKDPSVWAEPRSQTELIREKKKKKDNHISPIEIGSL